jgi:hypothetical protein
MIDPINLDLDVRLAINDSIIRFYYLVDSGKAASTAALFTVDARLTIGPGSPQAGTLHGVAIATAMEARERLASAFTRHVISNVMLTAAGEDIVQARYLLVLFRSDDAVRDSRPSFVADIDEVWHRAEIGWLIAERTVMPTFSRV